MKLLIAYIRPEHLTPVKQALFQAEIFKITITNALGCGAEPPVHENYRGADAEVDLHKRVRLEIGLNDAFVHKAIDAITSAAVTDGVGDGKILLLPLEEVVRVRTGERGFGAVS